MDRETSLTRNEMISCILKEYDAIRKEIDDKTNPFQTRAVPVLLVVAGGVISWQAKIPGGIILLLLPTVIMAIANMTLNAWFLMDRAGRWLSIVEDRVYRTAGEALLTHETSLAIERQNGLWKWPVIGGTLPVLYIVFEYSIFSQLDPAVKSLLVVNRAFWYFFIGLLLAPAGGLVFWCLAILSIRRRPLSTELSRHLLRLRQEKKESQLKSVLSNERTIEEHKVSGTVQTIQPSSRETSTQSN